MKKRGRKIEHSEWKQWKRVIVIMNLIEMVFVNANLHTHTSILECSLLIAIHLSTHSKLWLQFLGKCNLFFKFKTNDDIITMDCSVDYWTYVEQKFVYHKIYYVSAFFEMVFVLFHFAGIAGKINEKVREWQLKGWYFFFYTYWCALITLIIKPSNISMFSANIDGMINIK